MSTKGVLELLLCIGLLVLLWHQERGTLNAVHLHELLTRLRHGLITGLLLLEISVELLKLVVLLQNILNVRDLHLSGLRDLLLLIWSHEAFGVVLFVVVHSSANFVLSLKSLNLSVLTPDHKLES